MNIHPSTPSDVFHSVRCERWDRWKGLSSHISYVCLIVCVSPAGDDIGQPFWTRLIRSGEGAGEWGGRLLNCHDLNAGSDMRRLTDNYRLVWSWALPGGVDTPRIELLERMYKNCQA